MATPRSLTGLLESLTLSLSSAYEVGPKIAAIEAPRNGVSLLNVKNDILLSYLQNLVFLILLKLRNAKAAPESEPQDATFDDVVSKLAELRLYLEKGVRPLEEKLRFSLENMLRAADDAERKEASKPPPGTILKAASDDGDDESGSDEDSDEVSDEEEDDEDKPRRPQLSGYTQLVDTKPAGSDDKPGVWRPTKTRRVVMPEPGPRQKRERVAHKSATVEEYVATELAAGPLAEPSVGTTILDRGRKVTTASERKKNEERQEYEERNFLRLPKENKKERAKQNKIAGKSSRMEFGGEEWRDLGDGVDRIERLTRQKNAPKGTRALLEKSRKRTHDATDGPKQSGAQDMGDRFAKRLKNLENRNRGKGRR